MIFEKSRQSDKAIDCWKQCVALAREIDNPQDEAIVCRVLGSTYADLGQFETAITYYEQSLALLRRIGNRAEEAGTLGELGECYYRMGQVDKAIDCHQQRLTVARDNGLKRAEGFALTALGVIPADQGLARPDVGEIEKAITYLDEAWAIARDIEDPNLEAAVLGYLGNAYFPCASLRRPSHTMNWHWRLPAAWRLDSRRERGSAKLV